MYQNVYYVDKRSGTFADILAAYGLAAILDQLLFAALGRFSHIVLKDSGPCYQVELEQPVEEEWLLPERYFDLLRYIDTGKNKNKIPAGMHYLVDYQAEKEKISLYFAMRKNLPAELKRPDAPPDHPAVQELNQLKPHPLWPVWSAINQMGAVSVYNDVAGRWYANRQHVDKILRLLLHLCSTHPNPLAEVEAAWKRLAKEHELSGKPQVTASQFFNPAAGKGANRSKADKLTIGNLENFWLLELLKAVGMQESGLPLRVQPPGTASGGRPPKDRKTYVVIPVELSFREHQQIFQTFRETLYSSTAIKMDILAALRYMRVILRYCEANRASNLAVRFFASGPQRVVAGLAVAFYKDMGSAVAVMNQSQINLPGWVAVQDPQEVQDYLKALEEHERIIRSLEERGEEFTLLSCYRDFLSAHDLEPLYEFTGHYGNFWLGQMERGRRLPQFSTTNLRRVIMGTNRTLKEILDNPGFQHVAEAIRRSTVIPQYRKMRGERLYDVRYGLGNELKRKANYNDEFLQALSDFMQSYNQENAQIAETRRKQFRRNLTTEDIMHIVELVDTYGAKTVGNLLVAYGYARDPREPDVLTETGELAPEEGEQSSEEEEGTEEE